jgi:hypothetical protein
MLAMLLAASALGQDIIIKKNAEEIEAKVVEVTDTHVKYRKFSNQSGPIYNVPKNEVLKIKYENGDTDTFVTRANPATSAPAVTSSSVGTGRLSSTLYKPTPPRKTHAEKTILGGFRTGVTISNIATESDYSIYPRLGFTVGGLVEFKLANWLSIQPELRVTMKGSKFEGDTQLYYVDNPDYTWDVFEESRTSLFYFELPVNFLFKIPIAKRHFINLGIGPYVAYGIAGVEKNRYFEDGKEVDDEDLVDSAIKHKVFSGEQKMFRPFDFGLNCMAGFEFASGFFIDAGYSFGLTTIYIDKTVSVRNNYFSLSLGCKF